MRSSVLGSALAHVLLLGVLFWVRTGAQLIVPGPDVVQVQLVELGRIGTPPAPAPRPAPKPQEREVQIKPSADETGVKLAPPARKPAKPGAEEKPTSAGAVPQLPSAPVGSTGLRGELSVDAANFEFTYYLLVIRNRIASVWAPPAGLVTGGRQIRAVVFFRVTRSGELSEIRLERASGVPFFDQSALRAVTVANPMPPLPFGFAAPDLGVHFGFEYGG
jgi:protein TonB